MLLNWLCNFNPRDCNARKVPALLVSLGNARSWDSLVHVLLCDVAARRRGGAALHFAGKRVLWRTRRGRCTAAGEVGVVGFAAVRRRCCPWNQGLESGSLGLLGSRLLDANLLRLRRLDNGLRWCRRFARDWGHQDAAYKRLLLEPRSPDPEHRFANVRRVPVPIGLHRVGLVPRSEAGRDPGHFVRHAPSVSCIENQGHRTSSALRQRQEMRLEGAQKWMLLELAHRSPVREVPPGLVEEMTSPRRRGTTF